MLSDWLRAIRVKFLLASVIAVSNGLAISFWRQSQFDFTFAILTYVGVIFLHASVDLLNDYWDFKRGIDTNTKRTTFSGGTGVLPENILKPRSLYAAGIIFLILGACIGAYFVALRGVTIAVILGFAILAIYFYSTSIVNAGLGELFVAIKGAMIVLGAYYVQTAIIEPAPIYVGAIIGILSASILFVNSFPDYNADKGSGRRTLVILLGRQRASVVFPMFFLSVYLLVLAGIFLGYTKVYSLACFVSAPFAVISIRTLRNNHEDLDKLILSMSAAVMCSRITAAILAVSFLF